MILVLHYRQGGHEDLRLDVPDTQPIPRVDEIWTFNAVPGQSGWEVVHHWIVLMVEHVWPGVPTVRLHVEPFGHMEGS